ncbi:MAG: hypothetical protein HYR68_02080, partial [Burkholderiales bacterium]|nr:hypothetical protein [Burkholderiales bacterium]
MYPKFRLRTLTLAVASVFSVTTFAYAQTPPPETIKNTEENTQDTKVRAKAGDKKTGAAAPKDTIQKVTIN